MNVILFDLKIGFAQQKINLKNDLKVAFTLTCVKCLCYERSLRWFLS